MRCRQTRRLPAFTLIAVTLLVPACGGDRTPTFNPLPSPARSQAPSSAAAAPKAAPKAAPTAAIASSPTAAPFASLLPFASPTPEPPPRPGSSSVVITGEVQLRTTQDFQCSYAVDDFFIRGRMGEYKGVPMYMSINVEFYKRPGAYTKRTQVLIRRISSDNTFYASWYQGQATGTVLPDGRGFDLEQVEVPPEQGTDSTRPITVRGHFGCEGNPRPGPG